MLIERPIYLNRLVERKDTNAVKIITGVRRCGKSYLLLHIYRDHLIKNDVRADHIIAVQFDQRSNRHLCNPDALISYLKGAIKDGKIHYIFLDEIQMVSDFESVVNEINSLDNTDVYITGSNSKFLSSDIVTEFRGRGDEIRIRPLSFAEFSSSYGGDKYRAWEEYCLYGGMPELLEKKSEDAKAEYLKTLMKEVYIKDIVERNNVKLTDMLGRIIDSLLSSIGSLTNPNRTCASLAADGYDCADYATVAKYIESLEDAFIFERSDRFDVKGREYLSTPSKYYVCDVGLRNARLNFRQHEVTHIMENIIYNELRTRGYSVDVGVIGIREKEGEKSGYRKLEIDFIANKGDKRYYIQSAYTCVEEPKRAQEIRPFLKINDSFKKIIVTGDNMRPWMDDNGVLTVNILDFLLNQDSLNL